MCDCCSAQASAPLAPGCHACGNQGTAVDALTVKALLTESALQRFTTSAYRFCPGESCEVVYFGADGLSFTVAELRVSVWQKQPCGDRTLCYCFGENERRIRQEVDRDGASGAVQRIREHITAGRCACEVRNPKGTCCLGDIAAVVRRVAADVQVTA